MPGQLVTLAKRFPSIPTLSLLDDMYSKLLGVQPVRMCVQELLVGLREGYCSGVQVHKASQSADAKFQLPEGATLRWVGDVLELAWSGN